MLFKRKYVEIIIWFIKIKSKTVINKPIFIFSSSVGKKKYSSELEKKGHYRLTLKDLQAIQLNELNIDILIKKLKMLFLIINISIMKSLIFWKENIYNKRLTCGYYLKNNTSWYYFTRWCFILDENRYNHHHDDYEIEIWKWRIMIKDFKHSKKSFNLIIRI